MTQRLLVVDENSTIQRVVKLAFKGEAIQVLTVPRGRDPLEQIEEDPPDIVLADNGAEVAVFVKSRPTLSRIPVVLLKGAFDEPGNGPDDARGCDAVLMKPLQPEAMIDLVKRLLKRAAAPAPKPAPAAKSARPQNVPRPDPELELDRYFDNLAVAFSTAENGSPASSTGEIWTQSMLSADVVPAAPPGARPGPPPGPGTQTGTHTSSANTNNVDAGSEQLVELITQRVLDRLSDRVTRATAAELVARLSKWLLVDEVERSRA
jgi:two-component system chemotaxis response regulator CheY